MVVAQCSEMPCGEFVVLNTSITPNTLLVCLFVPTCSWSDVFERQCRIAFSLFWMWQVNNSVSYCQLFALDSRWQKLIYIETLDCNGPQNTPADQSRRHYIMVILSHLVYLSSCLHNVQNLLCNRSWLVPWKQCYETVLPLVSCVMNLELKY